MFMKTIEQRYKRRFIEDKGKLAYVDVEMVAQTVGFDLANLQEKLLKNTADFRKFALSLASCVVVGRVACFTYAAAVALLAERVGLSYTVMAGFCMPKNCENYDKNMKEYNERKVGKEHPMPATHIYLEINGVEYEYYGGFTSDIDKIDVVQVEI